MYVLIVDVELHIIGGRGVKQSGQRLEKVWRKPTVSGFNVWFFFIGLPLKELPLPHG
jgi:hypothetical protein